MIINPFIFAVPFVNTKSLLFDGVDDDIDCGEVTALKGVSEFSYSFWVKPTATPLSIKRLIGFYQSAGQTSSMFSQADMSFGGFVANGGASYAYTSPNTLIVGTWSNIALVFDGSLTGNANRMKIYLDGVLQTLTFAGTIPATTSTVLQDFYIGGVRTTTASFNGNIDEVGVYDYALSQSNATSVYNSGTPQDLMSTVGLIQPLHYYRMGDDALDVFPNIEDIGSSASNNGTMTNMSSGDIVADVP